MAYLPGSKSTDPNPIALGWAGWVLGPWFVPFENLFLDQKCNRKSIFRPKNLFLDQNVTENPTASPLGDFFQNFDF